jgi:hypothetical protein
VPFHHHADGDGVDHHEHEPIVELTSVPTRFEADTLVAALEARGIKASAVHGDSGGWMPQYSILVGHRVLVFEGDLDAARAILADGSD